MENWIEVKGKRKGKSADSGAGVGGAAYCSYECYSVVEAANFLYTYENPLDFCKNHANYLRETDNNDSVQTLDDYFSDSRIPTVESFKVPSKHNCKKLPYSYVPEVHIPLFRAMIQYLCDIHKHGVSLRHFDESNLVVQGGKLKFRRLEFVVSAGLWNQRRDCEQLHDIIKNMIVKHNRNNYSFPTLFDDLLKMYGGHDDRFTFQLALQSHHLRLDTVINFFDNSSYLLGEDCKRYYRVLEEMSRNESYLEDWTKRFDGSDPQVGPAKDCFDHEPKEKQEYKGTGPPREVNRHILRFCRNMAVHLHEHMGKHTKSFFDKRDVDLTIMALFEHELLSFQKLAHEHGILKYFIPGEEATSSLSGQSSSCGGRGQGRGEGQGQGQGGQSNYAGWRGQCSTPSSTTRRSST